MNKTVLRKVKICPPKEELSEKYPDLNYEEIEKLEGTFIEYKTRFNSKTNRNEIFAIVELPDGSVIDCYLNWLKFDTPINHKTNLEKVLLYKEAYFDDEEKIPELCWFRGFKNYVNDKGNLVINAVIEHKDGSLSLASITQIKFID